MNAVVEDTALVGRRETFDKKVNLSPKLGVNWATFSSFLVTHVKVKVKVKLRFSAPSAGIAEIE